MLINNNISNRVATTTPSPKAGQLWKDSHPESNQALLLVLDVDLATDRVFCICLITGKISNVHLKLFNGGNTRYFFAGELRQVNKAYLEHLENRDAQERDASFARALNATHSASNRPITNGDNFSPLKAAQEYLASKKFKDARDYLLSRQLLAV